MSRSWQGSERAHATLPITGQFWECNRFVVSTGTGEQRCLRRTFARERLYPGLERLGKMMHSLDVVGSLRTPEAAGFEALLTGAREQCKNDDELLDALARPLVFSTKRFCAPQTASPIRTPLRRLEHPHEDQIPSVQPCSHRVSNRDVVRATARRTGTRHDRDFGCARTHRQNDAGRRLPRRAPAYRPARHDRRPCAQAGVRGRRLRRLQSRAARHARARRHGVAPLGVSAVQQSLESSGFTITTLHNHLLNEVPHVVYRHYLHAVHGFKADRARRRSAARCLTLL